MSKQQADSDREAARIILRYAQRQKFMNTDPAFASQESLVPSLFRIASRAATKAELKDRSTLSEMMLEPKRLEAILKAIGKKKKPTPKRAD
jgi:hypothetical protein